LSGLPALIITTNAIVAITSYHALIIILPIDGISFSLYHELPVSIRFYGSVDKHTSLPPSLSCFLPSLTPRVIPSTVPGTTRPSFQPLTLRALYDTNNNHISIPLLIL
jgi:hypothetical protein